MGNDYERDTVPLVVSGKYSSQAIKHLIIAAKLPGSAAPGKSPRWLIESAFSQTGPGGGLGGNGRGAVLTMELDV